MAAISFRSTLLYLFPRLIPSSRNSVREMCITQKPATNNCRQSHEKLAVTAHSHQLQSAARTSSSSTQGQTITCKAAVVWSPNQPFNVETVEVAPPKEGEVRIKMCSTGICHSDVHILHGCDKNYPFPSVLGHEGAGVIESVGEDVKDFAPGDIVVPLFQGYCGNCDYCRSYKTNLCQRQPLDHLQRDHTTRITCNGKILSQLFSVSTFSEYTVTSEQNVTKISPEALVNKICLVGCCIPTGYGAAVQCARVEPDATCAIWGLGGVGLNVVLGCRDSKASKIIGIDTNPRKFPLAEELGCTHVLNPKDYLTLRITDVLAELTGAAGVDYCFVSVGSLEAMEEAFDASHPAWGQTIVIGLTDTEAKMKADVWGLLFGRQLKGTFCGSYKAKLEIPKLVEKIIIGQIPLDKFISHVIPLEDINQGVSMLLQGERLRQLQMPIAIMASSCLVSPC